MRPIVQQTSTTSTSSPSEVVLENSNAASTSITNARNWTTYIPETENKRKKCIELSATLPVSTGINHTINSKNNTSSSKYNRFNQNSALKLNNNNNIAHNNVNKDSCSERNSDLLKNNLLKHCDNTSNELNHLNNTTIFQTDFHQNIPDIEHSAKQNNLIKIDIDDICDKSNVNLECAPLIQISPNKSITLVKQNSTSLIFTKKDVNPVVHRKRVTLVRSSEQTNSTNDLITVSKAKQPSINIGKEDDIPIISHTDETISSPKKRHSFHWHSERGSGLISNDKSKRQQIKSWYAVIGSPLGKESAFNSDSEV